MSGLRIRGQAGGSVELQVPATLATDEVVDITTGGIENGIGSSGGDWTKFPDGTLIQTLTTSVFACNIAHSGGFYRDTEKTISTLFIDDPIISAVPMYDSNMCWVVSAIISDVHEVRIRMFSLINGATASAQITAIGRWK